MTDQTDVTPDDVTKDSPAIEQPQEPEAKQAEPQQEAPASDDNGENPKAADYVPDEKDIKINRQRAANQAMLNKINELTAKLKELEPLIVKDHGEPKPDQFDTQEDYLLARGKYEAKREFEAQKQAEAQQRLVAEQQNLIREKEKLFQDQEAALKLEKPDYEGYAKDAELAYTQMQYDDPKTFEKVRDYVFLAAENIPALMYHIGQNPEKLESLKGKSAPEVFKTLAKIELEISSSPKPQKQPLPAPVEPLSGVSKGTKSLEEMSGKELMEWVKRK